MVLRESMTAVAMGAVIGVVTALTLSRYLAALLYGAAPRDTTTMLGAVALLGLVAFTAALLPARRATRVDPTEAMRAECGPESRRRPD